MLSVKVMYCNLRREAHGVDYDNVICYSLNLL